MHRSITLVLLGMLTLPLALVSASVVHADHRTTPRTVGVTVKTDAMPTRVEVTSVSGRLTCVRLAAGPGRERRIRLTLEGHSRTSVSTRLGARRTSTCLLAGTRAPRGSTLRIRVEEDVPGPFNPRGTAVLRL